MYGALRSDRRAAHRALQSWALGEAVIKPPRKATPMKRPPIWAYNGSSANISRAVKAPKKMTAMDRAAINTGQNTVGSK